MTNVQLPMQNGSSGEGVSELQYRLLYVGSQLAATGTFDQSTYIAVLTFQEHKGLEQTGVVDDNLWHLLVADSNQNGYTPPQTMSTNVLETDTKVDDQMRIDFNNLAAHLADRASHQVDAIDSAVAAFANSYAKARLKDFSSITPQYSKMLARHLSGEMGKAITGAITVAMTVVPGGAVATFVVQSIWIAASMTMERQAGTFVEHAFSDEQRSLEHSIDEMAAKSHATLTQGLATIKKDAEGQIQQVIEQINNNDQLDEVTTALAEQIYKGGPQNFDAVLQTWFNIPGDLEALRRAAYEGLVLGMENFLAEQNPNPSPPSHEGYYEKNAREFEEEHRVARTVRSAVEGLPPDPSAQHE